MAILPVMALLITAAFLSGTVVLSPAEGTWAAGEGRSRVLGTATRTATATPAAGLTPSPTPTPLPAAPAPTSPSPTVAPTARPPAPATPTRRPASTRTPTAEPTATPTPLLPTPDGVERVAHVPILMYHHVDDPPPGADDIRKDLSVSPVTFEEQLQYLEKAGYRSVTLSDLALYLAVGRPLPDKPIILTFDDGYRDAYVHALPALKRHGFAGTFFLTTSEIDNGNPEWLTWEQVREMHAAGMAFEPHGYDHSDLRGRSFEFLVFRVLASKEAIEERTGETCRFFAYPSGRYDQFVIDVLRSADFWGAVTIEQGATHTAGDLFELRRVRVHGGDDLDTFIRTVNLDW